MHVREKRISLGGGPWRAPQDPGGKRLGQFVHEVGGGRKRIQTEPNVNGTMKLAASERTSWVPWKGFGRGETV